MAESIVNRQVKLIPTPEKYRETSGIEAMIGSLGVVTREDKMTDILVIQ